MKVFAEPQLDDFCINRISHALKLYAPTDITFVNSENEADLVISFVHGRRKDIWWRINRLRNSGRDCAVVQMSLKYTSNPNTIDWLPIWEKSKLVWSYYDLPTMCKEEGNTPNFNFYHAPLGVDSEVFQETRLPKKYIIGIHSKGWSKESLKEVVTAARTVGKTVLNFETPKDFGPNVEYTGIVRDDKVMAKYYSQCQYVSGLRRAEGFELPVIEGLLCGARPICYDHPCYTTWFSGLAEFISEEGGKKNIIPQLVDLFSRHPTPVSDSEKQVVKEKFAWKGIIENFWDRI